MIYIYIYMVLFSINLNACNLMWLLRIKIKSVSLLLTHFWAFLRKSYTAPWGTMNPSLGNAAQ
jgi:hypothetical protein